MGHNETPPAAPTETAPRQSGRGVIVEIRERSLVREKRPGFWRFWLKRLAKALLVLVMIAVGIPVWQNYWATKKLQETLAEMDRTEPGWRLEEIEAAREQIPE